MPKSQLIISIAALPLVVACQFVSAKTGTADNSWILTQKSHLVGTVKVYITDKGVKASLLESGKNISSMAPFREVCIYSLKTKKVHRLPFEKYRGQFGKEIALLTGTSPSEIPLQKIGATKILGVEAEQFKNTANYAAYQKAIYKNGTISNSSAKTAEYTATQTITAVPQIGTLLARMYVVPRLKGVPLEFRIHDMNDDGRVYLTTSSIVRSPVSESEFSIPAGLKAVQTPEEVSVRDNDDEGMQLILNGADRKILH
jgi:hypothetical protein